MCNRENPFPHSLSFQSIPIINHVYSIQRYYQVSIEALANQQRPRLVLPPWILERELQTPRLWMLEAGLLRESAA